MVPHRVIPRTFSSLLLIALMISSPLALTTELAHAQQEYVSLTYKLEVTFTIQGGADTVIRWWITAHFSGEIILNEAKGFTANFGVPVSWSGNYTKELGSGGPISGTEDANGVLSYSKQDKLVSLACSVASTKYTQSPPAGGGVPNWQLTIEASFLKALQNISPFPVNGGSIPLTAHYEVFVPGDPSKGRADETEKDEGIGTLKLSLVASEIPEFPIGPVLVLAASLGLALYLLRWTRKPIVMEGKVAR